MRWSSSCLAFNDYWVVNIQSPLRWLEAPPVFAPTISFHIRISLISTLASIILSSLPLSSRVLNANAMPLFYKPHKNTIFNEKKKGARMISGLGEVYNRRSRDPHSLVFLTPDSGLRTPRTRSVTLRGEIAPHLMQAPHSNPKMHYFQYRYPGICPARRGDQPSTYSSSRTGCHGVDLRDVNPDVASRRPSLACPGQFYFPVNPSVLESKRITGATDFYRHNFRGIKWREVQIRIPFPSFSIKSPTMRLTRAGIDSGKDQTDDPLILG